MRIPDVKIVRCKDCKYYTGGLDGYCERHFRKTGGNLFFCADGESEVDDNQMIIDDNFRFDQWLGREITKREWTMQEMADHSGLSRPAIVHLTSGDRNPTLFSLRNIVQALGYRLEIKEDE